VVDVEKDIPLGSVDEEESSSYYETSSDDQTVRIED